MSARPTLLITVVWALALVPLLCPTGLVDHDCACTCACTGDHAGRAGDPCGGDLCDHLALLRPDTTDDADDAPAAGLLAPTVATPATPGADPGAARAPVPTATPAPASGAARNLPLLI